MQIILLKILKKTEWFLKSAFEKRRKNLEKHKAMKTRQVFLAFKFLITYLLMVKTWERVEVIFDNENKDDNIIRNPFIYKFCQSQWYNLFGKKAC